MKKIIVKNSPDLILINDFLKFNRFEYTLTEDSINNILSESLSNTIVVVDYHTFFKNFHSHDNIEILINFCKNNQVLIGSDIDNTLIVYRHLKEIEVFDEILKNKSITFLTDAESIEEVSFKNIQFLKMSTNWFFKSFPRKTVSKLEKVSCNKDFLLTMRRKDLHRDILWNHLQSSNLLERGFSIYHSTYNHAVSGAAWIGETPALHSWADGHPSMDLYSNSWFEVVAETKYQSFHFVTEKTLKPIATKTPFVILSTPGYLGYLRSLGFETFSDLIDERYDNEENLEIRCELLVSQIQKIIRDGSQNFYEKSKDILDHNYSVLAKKVGLFNDQVDHCFFKYFLR